MAFSAQRQRQAHNDMHWILILEFTGDWCSRVWDTITSNKHATKPSCVFILKPAIWFNILFWWESLNETTSSHKIVCTFTSSCTCSTSAAVAARAISSKRYDLAPRIPGPTAPTWPKGTLSSSRSLYFSSPILSMVVQMHLSCQIPEIAFPTAKVKSPNSRVHCKLIMCLLDPHL